MTERKRVCNTTTSCKAIAALLVLLCIATGMYAQKGQIQTAPLKKYSFIHQERNELVNPGSLDSFFEKLYLQKMENKSRLRVLHIGDSHIQADYLSSTMRTNMQKDFGNGGRGVVVPLRVAGSNEPFNYKITSNVACTSKRCIFVNNPMPIGIGGVTIQTDTPGIYFHLSAFDYPPLNYAFNKVTLFYQKDSTSFDFRITDTVGNQLGILSSSSLEKYPNISSTTLPSLTSDIIIRAEKSSESQTQATIFGLSLENDSAGVVYNTVGANGAEAFHYVRARYFAEQTAVVNPDLVIISLGTNEAQRRPLDANITKARLDSLVQAIKGYNPNAVFLLTTPPDSYYRRKYYNTSVGTMHTVIVNYAKEHDIAVWDLYSIGGGYKSCYSWKKYGLMQRDGVHFTRAGYQYQGNLLYTAFIQAYNKYVSTRPQ